jgi:hypothetical protein
MVRRTFRRIASVAAMLGLAVASAPGTQSASAASAASAASVASAAGSLASHAVATTPVERTRSQDAAGRGWGGMIGCAACIVGAGIVIAGGPATIVAALYTPGSAIAALACAATCYEAFQ